MRPATTVAAPFVSSTDIQGHGLGWGALLGAVLTLAFVASPLVLATAAAEDDGNPGRNGAQPQTQPEAGQAENGDDEAEAEAPEINDNALPLVRVRTNLGTFDIELFEDRYPNGVANFIRLVEQGFYDNTRFHRIIAGFIIQGGDPNTRNELNPDTAGTGGPSYRIADDLDPEPIFDRAGLVAYANSGPDTNGSQFFITMAAASHLNGQYMLIGRVVDGKPTIRAIERTPVVQGRSGERSWPQRDVVIEQARVVRKRSHAYNVERLDDPDPTVEPEESAEPEESGEPEPGDGE